MLEEAVAEMCPWLQGFSLKEIQHEAVDKAMRLAKILGGKGFDDITQDEVNNLINAHSEPLVCKDLLELTKSASEEEEEAGDIAVQYCTLYGSTFTSCF